MIPAPGAHNSGARGLEIRNPGATLPALRSGDVVQARVLAFLGGGRWSLSVGGHTVVARSALPLVPGSVLAARAELRSDTLLLRTTVDSSIADFLRSNNIGTDAATRTLVEAMMRSGLVLDPAQIRRMRAQLGRSDAGLPLSQRARLLAVASAKGLELSPDAVDGPSTYAGSDGGTDERRRRRGRHPAAEEDTVMSAPAADGGDPAADRAADSRSPAADRGGDRREPTSDKADAEEAHVRRAVTRTADSPDHPLHLFNLAPGPADDHWVIVPLGFTADDTDYSGSLRLCFARAERLLRRASLVVRSNDRCWGFEWQMEGDRPTNLVIHPDPGGSPPPSAAVRELGQRLATLGLDPPTLAGADADAEPFDGFSSALPMDIMQSVQEEA